MKMDIKISNIGSMCRTCLSQHYLSKSCDSKLTINNAEVLVSYIIKILTNIELGESKASNWICKNCEHALANAYAFREQAIAVQEKFIEFNIKEELAREETNDGIDQDCSESYGEPESEHSISVEVPIKDGRKCIACDFIGQGIRGLSQHISQKHKELQNRWCKLCLEKVENISVHTKQYHGARLRYRCDFCPRKFALQSNLTLHLKVHSGEPTYSCSTCNASFTKLRTLKSHERSHTLKPFKCEFCVKRFINKKFLKKHTLKHPESQVKVPLKINKIRTIEETMGIVSEVVKEEIDEEDNKICTICDKSFSKPSILKMHMSVHTGETPHLCKVCNRGFANKINLEMHANIHTGERPHVCNHCGKTFSQLSVLNTHLKLHTGRPYKCTLCEKTFCRPATLKQHMRKHTGEKPFLCTECGAKFTLSSHLKEHMRTHSDERLFSCTHCGFSFKQKSCLKAHIRIHTGENPYKCTVCTYACKQSYSLTKHMKQHERKI